MKQKMINNEILDELKEMINNGILAELKEIRILPITYTESEQDALDAVIHLLENLDDRILEETYISEDIDNGKIQTNIPPKQLHYSAVNDDCKDVVQWASSGTADNRPTDMNNGGDTMSKIMLDKMPKTPKDCPFYIGGCDGMHRCRLMDECLRHLDHVPCNFITALSRTYTTPFATGLTVDGSDIADTPNYTISAVYDPHKSESKPPITVGELIKLLNDFPQDMPVGINFQPYSEIEIGTMTWTDDNYPYEKLDFDYVNIQ